MPLLTPAVAGGSSTVFINGSPAARVGDAVSCGGVIIGGVLLYPLVVDSEIIAIFRYCR